MDKILRGAIRFREEVFPPQQKFFEYLASKKQTPKALFITCADSRIDSNLLTQTEPGDLFLIRNAGNIVPPAGTADGGVSATIEYAIEVLGIRNIILCGHSQCGAMNGLLRSEDLKDLPMVSKWFAHAQATKRIVDTKYKHLSGEELVVAATEENVLVQINNLSTHPCVASLLAVGELNIFGWYYDIATGRINQYDPQKGQFTLIDEATCYAVSPAPVRSIHGNGVTNGSMADRVIATS